MQHFFTNTDKVHEIVKGLNLTKTLYVSSIVIGEKNSSKKTLVKHLFPNVPIVSATQREELLSLLDSNDELIITDYEKLQNRVELDFTNKRIIAVANTSNHNHQLETIFAFVYEMPPLSQRPKDIPKLVDIFLGDAKSTLLSDDADIEETPENLDITLNNKSLKKSIYYWLYTKTLQREDIQEILYEYMLLNLEGNDEYSRHLELYEQPLIKAGLKKYKSQLRLSTILGINRNTLRKKINEHKID